MSDPGFHGIPNEIIAAFLIDGLHRAERLAQADYAEIPPAYVVDAVQRRGK